MFLQFSLFSRHSAVQGRLRPSTRTHARVKGAKASSCTLRLGIDRPLPPLRRLRPVFLFPNMQTEPHRSCSFNKGFGEVSTGYIDEPTAVSGLSSPPGPPPEMKPASLTFFPPRIAVQLAFPDPSYIIPHAACSPIGFQGLSLSAYISRRPFFHRAPRTFHGCL